MFRHVLLCLCQSPCQLALERRKLVLGEAHPAAAKPQPLAPECFMLLILEVIAQHS